MKHTADKMKKVIRNIMLLALTVAGAASTSGCHDNSETETIGGGDNDVQAQALLIDIVDEEGNSLLDFWNNPDNILHDDDTRAEIKIVANGETYPLQTYGEIPPVAANGSKGVSRAVWPQPKFIGLYLAGDDNYTYLGGDSGIYLAFGQYKGNEAVEEHVTLYLPGMDEGIRIDYFRKADKSATYGYRTEIWVDNVKQPSDVAIIKR